MMRLKLGSGCAKLGAVVGVTTVRPAAKSRKLECGKHGRDRRPHIGEREIRNRLAYRAAGHAPPGAKRALAALEIDRVIEPCSSRHQISGADLGVETTVP